eukprot:TRINITY_DN569_c0_g1_i1.p1 TRINITY_DN569_c0_g1~~TRINITY_DN569_c0_g1_i1.p1  ORF type:complete len:245 (+),score=69.31 TRINITY_DN569_c0_g1_i1:73-735(+)
MLYRRVLVRAPRPSSSLSSRRNFSNETLSARISDPETKAKILDLEAKPFVAPTFQEPAELGQALKQILNFNSFVNSFSHDFEEAQNFKWEDHFENELLPTETFKKLAQIDKDLPSSYADKVLAEGEQKVQAQLAEWKSNFFAEAKTVRKSALDVIAKIDVEKERLIAEQEAGLSQTADEFLAKNPDVKAKFDALIDNDQWVSILDTPEVQEDIIVEEHHH